MMQGAKNQWYHIKEKFPGFKPVFSTRVESVQAVSVLELQIISPRMQCHMNPGKYYSKVKYFCFLTFLLDRDAPCFPNIIKYIIG